MDRGKFQDLHCAAPAWNRDLYFITFLFANLFAGALFYALLHILRERKLLPRYLPIAFGILYVASLGIRFIAV